MQTIEINGLSCKVDFSLRAIKLFEEIAGKSITESAGTWDNTIYFYSTIKALNPKFKLSFDEFIDYIEKNTDLLIQWQTMAPTDPDNAPPEATADKKKVSLFGLWTLSLLLLACLALAPIIFGVTSVFLSLKLIIMPIIWLGKKRKPLWKH